MRKRVLAAVLTLAMVFSLSVSASAANNVIRTEDVKISVDGKTIDGVYAAGDALRGPPDL